MLCEFQDASEPHSMPADTAANVGVSVIKTNCSPNVGGPLWAHN